MTPGVHHVCTTGLHSVWDNTIEPACEVSSGDSIELVVADASYGQIARESEAVDLANAGTLERFNVRLMSGVPGAVRSRTTTGRALSKWERKKRSPTKKLPASGLGLKIPPIRIVAEPVWANLTATTEPTWRLSELRSSSRSATRRRTAPQRCRRRSRAG